MDFMELYAQKRMTADQAAALVHSGDWVDYGWAVNTPVAVDAALAIADDLTAIGEVGLTGEIRSVSHLNQRLGEVARLGFKKCVIPRGGSEKLDIPEGLTVYRVRNLREAIEVAL